MRNNMTVSLLVGLSAAFVAVLGWMLPRRRKTPMENVMKYGMNVVDRLGDMRRPMMKTGLRVVKGMLR